MIGFHERLIGTQSCIVIVDQGRNDQFIRAGNRGWFITRTEYAI